MSVYAPINLRGNIKTLDIIPSVNSIYNNRIVNHQINYMNYSRFCQMMTILYKHNNPCFPIFSSFLPFIQPLTQRVNLLVGDVRSRREWPAQSLVPPAQSLVPPAQSLGDICCHFASFGVHRVFWQENRKKRKFKPERRNKKVE